MKILHPVLVIYTSEGKNESWDKTEKERGMRFSVHI
jgi:hypothetical protein